MPKTGTVYEGGFAFNIMVDGPFSTQSTMTFTHKTKTHKKNEDFLIIHESSWCPQTRQNCDYEYDTRHTGYSNIRNKFPITHKLILAQRRDLSRFEYS